MISTIPDSVPSCTQAEIGDNLEKFQAVSILGGRRRLMSPKNLLLTGSPGCGKTTVICRLIDLRLAGFYTQELREHGQRVGFEAVGLSGQRAILAHVGFKSKHRVSKYGVEPDRLDKLLQAELQRPADGFILDEIGKMELLCPAFVGAVPRLLDGPVPVVATIALKGQGLIAAVKARKDVRLIHVAIDNRDGLPEELEGWVRGRLGR
jgi:nucleoside-triphosphatase